jgi:homoserine O-acetyltransferase
VGRRLSRFHGRDRCRCHRAKAQGDVEKSLAELEARLASDPEWNGGRYYDRRGAKRVLTEMRVEMLKRNGIEAALAARYPDQSAREAVIRQQAADWARRWDANSLVILRRGTIGYDTVKDFRKIKAKVLYVLCRTDRLFPPSIAPAVMRDLAAAGVDARYFEIDSELGHSASGPEHAKWSPTLRQFLDPLIAGLG